MSTLDGLRYRLRTLRRALFDRAAWRREMDAELTHHLELEAMQRRHVGASDDDARRAARRALGDPRRVRERIVDDSGASALDALAQDLRFAGRTLRARPGFTAAAVLTLAVGIGANVAIFSAVDAMLLRRLPFREPERLMKVSLTLPPRGDAPAIDDFVWSYPKFVAFRDAQQVFADLTLYTDGQFTVRGGDPELVRAELTDARYLPTLGIRPALGRNFAPDEDRAPGGPKVVLLGDALWRRRFGGDSTIVGRAIDLAGTPYTVVGVLPPGFRGLTGRAELWTPILTRPAEVIARVGMHSYVLVARRAPGVSVERAQAAVHALGRRVDELFPREDAPEEHVGAAAVPLDATRVAPIVRRALLVLSGAVGLVLLVACANVASLLLVRAAGRRREIAVRAALGAGRGRLVRQLLTESVLLSTSGGVAGILVAWWGVRLLAVLDPGRMPHLGPGVVGALGAVSFDGIRLDGSALAFAALVTMGTGLLFGLAPALHATRPSLVGSLKDAGIGAVGRGRRALGGRAALTAVEVALACVLLAGAGLMLRSLGNLLAVRQGFDAERVLTLRVGTPEREPVERLPAYHARLLERVGALPGVAGVTLQDCAPLAGNCNLTRATPHDRPPAAEGREPGVGIHWIAPNWPAVLRVPVVRGRAFDAGDRLGTRKVVLVNETAARALWPGQDPIGRPLSPGVGGFGDDTAYVVGVLGDVRYGAADSLPIPDVYVSYTQDPDARLTLFVRAARGGDPLALVAPIRRVVRELAPNAPVFEVRTLADRVGDAMAFSRFASVLLALFAAVALGLATLGVYGVVSSATALRTREIGVRIALGATRRDVVRLVVGQGVAIAAAGAAVGLAGALVGTRVLRSLLYEVAPSDPATFAAIIALLVLAVALASWLPARRAAGVSATEALRAD